MDKPIENEKETKARKKVKSPQGKSAVVYEGHVTMKVMHGDKVVRVIRSKNEGGAPLMLFLANCLAGSYVYSDRPMYAAAVRGVPGEAHPLSPFPVPASTATVRSGNDGDIPYSTVSLTFVISGLSIASSAIAGYALYSAAHVPEYGTSLGLGNYSALTFLEEPLMISNGENVVVTWDMTLQNAEGQG